MNLKWIGDFITDIKANRTAMSALGSPNTLLDSAKAELELANTELSKGTYTTLTLDDKTSTYYNLVNGKITLKAPMGTVSVYRKDALVNRPYRVLTVGEEIWVFNYSQRPAIFDNDFSFKGYFGEYGNFESANRFAYCRGAEVSDDHVIMASVSRHRVGCFDRKSGELVWNFGDNTAGVPQDGRLYSPNDITFLPNGT